MKIAIDKVMDAARETWQTVSDWDLVLELEGREFVTRCPSSLDIAALQSGRSELVTQTLSSLFVGEAPSLADPLRAMAVVTAISSELEAWLKKKSQACRPQLAAAIARQRMSAAISS